MRTKLTKTDRLFLAVLSAGIVLQLVLTFSFPYIHDEYFYATIPYRLLQGDRLLQHDWHLSQLSSLFTFLPVWVWVNLTGSTDGLLIFLRYVFLVIYTGVAVIIYRYFRKYGKWAAAAAILFFTQTPYRVLSLNYHSVYTICTLLLLLCLLTISERPTPRISFAAGLCIGCCCVCNPMFAGIYVLYCVLCVLHIAGKRKHIRSATRYWTNFLSKEMLIFSFCGVCTIGVALVAFFFLTGGTVRSIFSNLPLLLQSSEYGLDANALLEKLKTTYMVFSNISLDMPYLLPLLYVVMLVDPKRYTHSHRCIYLFLALIIGVIYIAGILICVYTNNLISKSLFFSAPLLIITSTCFILTRRKNTRLFFCMWVPCAIAACVQSSVSNGGLTSLGFVLAVGNVAGVLFAGDLYREMRSDRNSTLVSNRKKSRCFGQRLICAGLCLQMLFQLVVCLYGQTPPKNPAQISAGPCAGMYVSEWRCLDYNHCLDDLDYIKANCPEDAPLLIVSFSSWMYLYADRPISTYSTWLDEKIQPEMLISYYQQNPEKIPHYIYVDSRYSNVLRENMEILPELFEFTSEELSRGVLLKVDKCKFQ